MRAQPKASHGPWLSPEAKAEGLVLTVDGAISPQLKKRFSRGGRSARALPQGQHRCLPAQGIDARRAETKGSARESPARKGVQNARTSVRALVSAHSSEQRNVQTVR